MHHHTSDNFWQEAVFHNWLRANLVKPRSMSRAYDGFALS